MKVLIDSNIALDVVLHREPFYSLGIQILGLSKGGAELFLSSSTITDIYYITKKELESKEMAMAALKDLLESVDVAAVTGNEIRRAIDLDWSDFEDAVQFAAGESLAVDYIVTRDISDYASATVPVVKPEQLLEIITSSDNS